MRHEPTYPHSPPALQWPAPGPVRPLAWAAVLVVHGAAFTGLAAAYWPPKTVPPRAPLSLQLLPSPDKAPEPLPAPPFPVSLESPSTVMLPVPTWPASAPQGETQSTVAGIPLSESVAPPELSDASLPALGPEALAEASDGLQLPDDKLRFLARPPLEVRQRTGQARLSLRFLADGSLRRVDLVRSSGRSDWDEEAIAAWRQARIEPVVREGRTRPIYTEVEQALPLR